jgi:hypothetical protein
VDAYAEKRRSMGVREGPKPIDRNITDLATGQLTVTSVPQQINYVSTRRIATRLTNLSLNQVFYGPTSGVTISTGDLLPAGIGQWVSIPARGVIFVVCASGLTSLIAWADAYE